MAPDEILKKIARAEQEQWLELDLTGEDELPPEIGKLTQLETLILTGLQARTLPAELAKLAKLRVLDLSDTRALPAVIFRLTRLQKLNLADNRLQELPGDIAELTDLQSLILNGNRLKTMPAGIAKLSNLEELRLEDNGLETLPAVVFKLAGLQYLDLSSNQLTDLPAGIAGLANLQILNLTGNQLNALPADIGGLTALQALFLKGNLLSALPAGIGKLERLQELDLENNHLATLPSVIAKLANLRLLHLTNNQLKTLPASLGSLQKNLQKLYLRNNYLVKLPDDIVKLTNLRALYAGDNQINALPSGIGKLAELHHLELDNNQLRALPPDIAGLNGLQQLSLAGNRLPIPPEILAKYDKPAEIFNYYFREDEKRPLNEAKMLLTGQGGAGKTSLMKRLLDNGFDPAESKTEGIGIAPWQVNIAGSKKIRVNLWDFGGQEIMHATHQFFLTKRSLYVLVLDTRRGEQENHIEYWLKIITSFSDGSPVIVVMNKADQHVAELDQRGLKQKYPAIHSFVRISCLTGEGIPALKAEISHALSGIREIQNELPLRWFKVKTRLENMREDYISYEKYAGLCREAGLEDETSLRSLIGFLHDLGVVLNFGEDRRLRDTNVLNPEWVTRGVYRIINSDLLSAQKGELAFEQLGEILPPAAYPRKSQRFIIDIMRKFELCFPLEGAYEQEHYLVPDLLYVEEPRLNWNYADSLAFQYHYPVLPGSILSRFIVRVHPLLKQKKTCWRNGAVLADKNNQALVKADREEKKIYVWITGRPNTRRDFLSVIRAHFDHIHQTVSGIEVREAVPLPEHPQVEIDYNDLLTLEEKGISAYFYPKANQEINVPRLLDGIESRTARKSRKNKKNRERIIMAEVPKEKQIEKPSAGMSVGLSAGLFTGLLVVLGILIWQLPRISQYNLGAPGFVVYAVTGLVAAFVTFGLLRSTGKVRGKKFGLMLEFGGPAALFFAVLLTGLAYESRGGDNFEITVYIQEESSKKLITKPGFAMLLLDELKKEPFGDGHVIFSKIPARYTGADIPLQIEVEGYEMAGKFEEKFAASKTSFRVFLRKNKP
ncbi:MAG: GTP-binding protein [Gammaproteobacteria bacterium]|nr:GTP-binding protein [Gammaproteobacteria bacterium]